MAEKTTPKPRTTRANSAKPAPKANPSPETADAPDLNAILSWLHTVDDVDRIEFYAHSNGLVIYWRKP